MSDNNPQPDPKKVLNVVENNAGSVPQTDVLQKPKYKPAQNLLEQLEYFKLQYTLKFRHVVWMGLATYICYDRYKAYQQYRDEKQQIFGKYRKVLQEKYGKLNQKYTQSTIHPRGDPDQGDWVYFQEMADEDQKLFLERKIVFQDKASNFNTFLPLYFTAGLTFPLTSFFIGLIFRKKVFDDKFTLNQNNKQISQVSSKIVDQQVTSETKTEQNQQNDTVQENKEVDVKKQEGKVDKISYIDYFIQEKLSNKPIYFLLAGFSIASSFKIFKYFS